MNFPTKYFAIDAAEGLIKREPGQSALTATGYVGDQHDMKAANAMDFIAVINIEALTIATDETYTFSIVASNATNRSDGTILGQITVGKASEIALETVDTEAGDQIVMRGRTEKNGKFYRYLDLHLAVAGDSESIAFSAYISKEIA